MSFLEGNGTPSMVERCMVRPPSARVGPVTPEERKAVVQKSPLKGKYDQAVDAESAYEVLTQRTSEKAAPPAQTPGRRDAAGQAEQPQAEAAAGRRRARQHRRHARVDLRHQSPARQAAEHRATGHARNHPFGDQPFAGQIAGDIGKSIGGSMGSTVGRAIVRGTLGGILRR